VSASTFVIVRFLGLIQPHASFLKICPSFGFFFVIDPHSLMTFALALSTFEVVLGHIGPTPEKKLVRH